MPVRLLLSQYQHRAITEASRHSAAAAAPRMIPAIWPVLRPGMAGGRPGVVGPCVVGPCVVGPGVGPGVVGPGVVGPCVVGPCVVGPGMVGPCVVGPCMVGGCVVRGGGGGAVSG